MLRTRRTPRRRGRDRTVMGFQQPALTIERLHRVHGDRIRRYLGRLVGGADAEDLTQQVFLAAHRKLSQLRAAQSARSWLFTILRHCFIKQCERRQPVPAANLELDVENIPAESPPPEVVDRERLQRAVDELPEHYRLVVAMFYYEDLSYREIAEKLGLPIGTVMSRLARAKGHLRSRLVEPNPSAGVGTPIARNPRG